VKALKALGQNFLNDPAIAAQIATLGELKEGDRVWEIGPGLGILTDEILSYRVQLRAFELDRRLPDYLSNKYSNNVCFEFGDVLQADWPALIEQDKAPLKLIANIPYQITSPLLHKLEQYASSFVLIVLMLQKEVAERLCARPGTKDYAPLTIRLRLWFEIRKVLNVGREKFDPIPKVDSAVVVITPRQDKPLIKNPEVFHRLVNAAFAHRRKNLNNNLVALIGKEKTLELQRSSKMDFTRRGESLEEAEFIRLSELMAAL
jgi:16S rRNA (adenine1518-N6/adenine1519-N6)-dimethyltransferase